MVRHRIDGLEIAEQSKRKLSKVRHRIDGLEKEPQNLKF